MHDRLFENQNALDDESLTAYAGEIELDVKKFDQNVQNNAFEKRIRADFTGGIESGVNGTPTFFINGARYDDALDYESLLAALEAV